MRGGLSLNASSALMVASSYTFDSGISGRGIFLNDVPQQIITLGHEVEAIFVLFHHGRPRHLIVYEIVNDRYALSMAHFLGFAFQRQQLVNMPNEVIRSDQLQSRC
ncbi:hypothetical protein [Ruegeria conchae]|uniref:Uncharacterized protein n=1 Tax=Ruegeria conchae TaxID=981384 RepID=A0A497ZSM6_9RHOB|nr:hypothetical protein [Ruegeria conchae]RLK07936.1 hypothetical protein CLV75_1600 [Ruegeria conchae]